MKLVEILERELVDWREGSEVAFQDNYGPHSKAIWFVRGNLDNIGRNSESDGWFLGVGVYPAGPPLRVCELADDHATAIVTRADWEAERARIAKPAKKASADEWIRHRGGKCPVDEGVVVDVRFRSGAIETNNGWPRWKHYGDGRDIMAYRIHKPAEQPEAKNATKPRNSAAAKKSYLEPCVLEKAAKNGDKRLEDGIASLVQHGRKTVETPEGYGEIITATLESTSGPLEWRDRIHEIDAEVTQRNEAHRQAIEALEEERASFVQRLEDEGLQLFQGKVCGGVQPAEDMSDWRNWKAGDELIYISDDCCNLYTKGKSYKVEGLHNDYAFVFDDFGGESVCAIGDGDADKFKWHSRPSA